MLETSGGRNGDGVHGRFEKFGKSPTLSVTNMFGEWAERENRPKDGATGRRAVRP